jgi:hypothetical protein
MKRTISLAGMGSPLHEYFIYFKLRRIQYIKPNAINVSRNAKTGCKGE